MTHFNRDEKKEYNGGYIKNTDNGVKTKTKKCKFTGPKSLKKACPYISDNGDGCLLRDVPYECFIRGK